MLGGAAIIALAASVLAPPPLGLVWNASPSSPLGLYAVIGTSEGRAGDMVVAWPPPAARSLAARRQYLPAGVPLVKNVAAVPGERVCAIGARILVGGRQVAVRRVRDLAGRPLPWWAGCRTLGPGELFLLAPSAEAFDGRYFGVTRRREIIGKAILLWRR